MAIDIRKLRQQSIMGGFDNLTPDIGGMNPLGPSGPMEEDPFGGASPSISQPMQEMNAGGMYDEAGPPPTKMGVDQYGGDMKAMIDQFYTPETTSRDRLNRLLDAAPEREEPNWTRKLVASGMGWGAKDPLGTMENVMYAPHARAMSDWKERTGPFQQAAQQENTANINERTLAGNVVVAKTQADRLASQQSIADEKNRIAKIRADAYEAKINGYTVKVEGDRVMGYKPDGTRIDLGSSGGLDEGDKLRIQGEWNVKAAEARGNVAANTASAAGAGVFQIENADGTKTTYTINPRTGKAEPMQGVPQGTLTRPGTPPAGDNATQATARRKEDERIFFNTHPQYQKYFTRNADGSVTLRRRPSQGFFQGDEEYAREVGEYDDVVRQLNPGADTSSLTPKPQALNPVLEGARGRRNPGPGTGVGPTVPGGGAGGPQISSGRGQPPVSRGAPPAEPASRKQQDFEVSNGMRLYLIKDGRIVGTIPNDPRSIEASKKEGYEIRGKQ